MQMSKPYDGQALVAALKKEGVEGGISELKKCVSILADFLRSSAQMSTEGLVGKLDDFAIPGINYFEKLAGEELDKLAVQMAPAPAPEAPAPAPEVASAEVPVETPAAVDPSGAPSA